jgi:hypothetical protein
MGGRDGGGHHGAGLDDGPRHSDPEAGGGSAADDAATVECRQAPLRIEEGGRRRDVVGRVKNPESDTDATLKLGDLLRGDHPDAGRHVQRVQQVHGRLSRQVCAIFIKRSNVQPRLRVEMDDVVVAGKPHRRVRVR